VEPMHTFIFCCAACRPTSATHALHDKSETQRVCYSGKHVLRACEMRHMRHASCRSSAPNAAGNRPCTAKRLTVGSLWPSTACKLLLTNCQTRVTDLTGEGEPGEDVSSHWQCSAR
jgi:hypothetical protein